MKIAGFPLLLVLMLGSCVPQTRTNKLAPVVRSTTQTGQAVTVEITQGSDQSRVRGLGVTASDFKNALESSLVDSGLFLQIGDGGYQLEATVVSMSQPSAVFGVTTDIIVEYTLRKSAEVVWTRNVRSNHVTETSETLIAEIRDRNSAEGAMRENIRLAISAMSERLR